MKKILSIALLLAILVSLAAYVPFEKGRYYDNIIHACFKMESVGNMAGVIEYNLSGNSTVVTGMESFDKIAETYKFIDMKQLYTPKDKKWNKDGHYLQCIYEIRISDNDLIQEAVEALNKNEHIHYAQYDVIMRERYVPNDPSYYLQYYIPITHTDEAWEFGQGSEDIVIGISDSGVYWNHPDLRDNIWINEAEMTENVVIDWDNGEIYGGDGLDNDQNGKIDDVIGWNFAMNNNNPHQDFPGNEHGTHVAGCAAAVGDNNIGVAGPGFRVKIACASGRSNIEASNGVLHGYPMLQYFADLGCDIGNASWGGLAPDYYFNEYREVIQYCSAQGMLVVAAAGNDNTEHNADYQDAPSDIPEVLCVAASTNNDTKAGFSDFGVPIDITAPGAGIYSTYYGDELYSSLNGTSMASPIVAGIAALVKSVHPNLTPEQLRARLETTADDIYPMNESFADVASGEFLLGTGRVNALAAAYYDVLPNINIEQVQIDEITGDGDGIPNPGETIEVTVQLNNLMYMGTMTPTFYTWATAYNVQATLSSPVAGVSISNETSDYGIISGGSSISNFNDKYVVTTTSDLTPDNIPMELTITANLDSEWPYTITRTFNLDLSLLHTNYPVNIGGGTVSSPTILDLNNDGTNEVVFTRPDGSLDALYADGTHYMPGTFPLSLGGTITGSPAFADLDGNETIETVVCMQSGQIRCIASDGTDFFAPYDNIGATRSNPIIADLDDNGTKEIIAVSQARELVILNSDGTTYSDTYPLNIGESALSPSAIGDVNNDGVLDIVIATTSSNLHVYNPSTGTELSGFPVNYNSYSLTGPTLAQLDSDMNMEILVASTATGEFHAFDDDGSVIFTRTLDSQIKTSPVVGRVNGNVGNAQIVVITTSGTVYVMDENGNDIPNFPISVNAEVESSPILAGLNEAGDATIIFGDNDGYIHGIKWNGQENINFPMHFESSIKASPSIGDLDSDGHMDVVFGDQYSIYDLDLKYALGNDNSAYYRGDIARTGSRGYLVVDNDEEIVKPLVNNILHNAYPNPFNPETTLSFELKESAQAKLEIFNIRGQKINTLINERMNKGSHSIVWKGNDRNGNTVPSGIYLYKLSAGSESQTKKAVLMK